MLRLSLYLTLLLAVIGFSGARTINLSRSDLETISKALNVALQPDLNGKHKLLERFNGKSDHDGLSEDHDDDGQDDDGDNDNNENGPSNGNNNGNRNGNNGNHNGNVYLQIFIGNQEQSPGPTPPPGFPTLPPWPTDPPGTWPTDWPTGTTWTPTGTTWTPTGTTWPTTETTWPPTDTTWPPTEGPTTIGTPP